MLRRSTLCTCVAAWTLTASAAHAGGLVTLWLQPLSGSFQDPSRWSQGVPGELDSAVFGESASTTQFDVTVLGQHVLDTLTIGLQSPRFHAESGRRGAPSLILTGSLAVNSPFPMQPSTLFDGVHLDSGLAATIGVAQTGGTLTLKNTEWTGRDVGVGLAGGLGTLVIGPNTNAVSADPQLPWRVGDGGNGTLVIESGSLLDLQGTTLRVGANGGGTGALTVKPGGILELGGATLYIGGTTSAGSGQTGSAAATIQGEIAGPGTIIIGYRSTGTVSAVPGSVLGGVGTAIRVGDGPSGIGTLNLLTSQSLDTVSVGNVATGSLWTIGASTVVTVNTLLTAQGGQSAVSVSDGATLHPATLSIGNRGGSIAALNATFQCDALSFSDSMLSSANVGAISPNGLVILPAIDFAETPSSIRRVDMTADIGGRMQTGAISTSALSWARCTSKNGGTFEVNGALSLTGSNQNHVNVGPLGTLTADSITTDAACAWTWTLPLDASPVNAASASITGPVQVTTSGGWTPATPSTIRLVHSSETLFSPASIATPTFFGYPALVAADDEGVVLRATDHIDGFGLPSSVALSFGQSIVLPTTITLDGVSYDVSDQSTWSFAPVAVVVRTGPRTFFAAGDGTATATVTFGAASATVAFDVGGAGAFGAHLMSGLGLFYGNADSGWDGPDLFASPYGFGPRSLSGNGRIAAFSSQASNLAAGDTGLSDDCFVTDIDAASVQSLSGLLGGTDMTTVSAPALSDDGRFVAFVGTIGSGSAIASRAILVDRQTLTPEVVSVDVDGAPAAADPLGRVALSDDGRFVAFTSTATTIVAGDTNGVADVFVRDRLLGTTVRASLSPAGAQFIGACTLADMTADGRFVVFLRAFGGWTLAYRFDRLTGAVDVASPGLIDETPAIKVIAAQVRSDGGTVLFTAAVSEPIVAGPPPIGIQLFQCDMTTGEVSAVSVLGDGSWFAAPIDGFAISQSGRYVALTTRAAGLVPGLPDDGNGRSKLYRLDRLNGSIIRLSDGLEGPYNKDVHPPVAITADGAHVGFVTRASNVLPLDTLGKNDVFVVDLAASPADLDGDGVVQAGDLAILLGAWGSASLADLDGDGIVGAGDIAILLGEWGEWGEWGG